jgi:tellurite resistance protein TerC
MTSIGFPVITTLAFLGIVAGMLYADIRSNRAGGVDTIARATKWSGLYIGAALGFALLLALLHGLQAASLFLTGYVLEKVLSVDNLIVFSAVFAYFKVGTKQQYAILKWGILGAVIFRLIFTVIGVGSLWLFGGWVELVFAFLVGWSAYKMLGSKDESPTDYTQAWHVKLTQKYLPASGTFVICLITIECTDILFAFDSVPTVIAVTRDPLLIYTSMIFAILGLRSLYFLLASIQKRMVYVEKMVIYILFFIAIKLGLHALFHIEISPLISFAVVISALTLGVLLSIFKGKEHGQSGEAKTAQSND